MRRLGERVRRSGRAAESAGSPSLVRGRGCDGRARRGGSGGSPSQPGRSPSTSVTAADSRGRRSRGSRGGRAGRAGRSQPTSSAAGFGGSGRWAARTRAPVAASTPAARSAANMPHWIPTVAPGSDTDGLSKSRQTRSSTAHPPAAMITVPSPPGRWKPLRWPRAQTRNSTPSATSSTAASTNENTWSAERLAVADTGRRPLSTKKDFSYHGSSTVRASTAAAAPACCSSGARPRSPRTPLNAARPAGRRRWPERAARPLACGAPPDRPCARPPPSAQCMRRVSRSVCPRPGPARR